MSKSCMNYYFNWVIPSVMRIISRMRIISAGDGIWTRVIQGIMGLAVPRRTRLGHPGIWKKGRYSKDWCLYYLNTQGLGEVKVGVFKSGQTSCLLVIRKANSTPLFHKHQLTRVELLLSRPDTFPWLRTLTLALQPEPVHQWSCGTRFRHWTSGPINI